MKTYTAHEFAIPRANLSHHFTLVLALALALAAGIRSSSSRRRWRHSQNQRDFSFVYPHPAERRLAERRKARRAIALALALQVKCVREFVHRFADVPLHRQQRERARAAVIRDEAPHVPGDRLEAYRRSRGCGLARFLAALLFCGGEGICCGCKSFELA